MNDQEERLINCIGMQSDVTRLVFKEVQTWQCDLVWLRIGMVPHIVEKDNEDYRPVVEPMCGSSCDSIRRRLVT